MRETEAQRDEFSNCDNNAFTQHLSYQDVHIPIFGGETEQQRGYVTCSHSESVAKEGAGPSNPDTQSPALSGNYIPKNVGTSLMKSPDALY